MATTTNASVNDTKLAVQSFWLLGLLNNAPWVLMLACATNISSGGVALVFLANQAPGLLTKLTAPFWFHKVSYRKRMKMASVAMGLACFLVGYGGLFNDEMSSQEEGDHPSANNDNTTTTSHARAQWGMMLELLGVSFTSFQCSLGEASLLALAGKFDSSLLPQLSSSVASLSSSLDSYAAVDNFNNNSVRAQHDDDDDDEGHFSQEDYQENNNRHDDEEDEQSAGIMKRSEKQQQRKCITAFASGTGLAGIIGYAYKSLLAELLGWCLSYIVWSAILFAIAYYCIYCTGLYEMEIRLEAAAATAMQNNRLMNDESRMMYSSAAAEEEVELQNARTEQKSSLEMVTQPQDDEEEEENDSPPLLPQHSSELTTTTTTTTKPVHDMTACERFQTVLSLWPYMIPLFFVYMTEYMMQAGVWPAIGFPVTSASARAQFYHYANWTYQVGVFISRSSGNLLTVSLTILWVMPMLQGVNLFLFWLISIHHFWYDYSLLLMCFIAGLLGGGVYVQGYNRINADMPKELREFAISSASVADSFGILVADISSLFIQSCIYERNGINGAVVNCPL